MKNKKLYAVLISIAILMNMLPITVLGELPQGVPERLDAPSFEKVELIYLERPRQIEKLAAFKLQVKLPQTALDLDAKRPAEGITIVEYSARVDAGEWVILEGGGYMDDLIGEPTFKVAGKNNTFYATAYAGEYGSLTAIDLKNHTYSIRAQLYYSYKAGDSSDVVYSGYSNILTLGKNGISMKPADWSKASTWAKPTLQKSVDLGLLPGILRGADMTKPITREEFCELAVLMYEVTTAKLAKAAATNPFSDTQNQQLLKAYKLGITADISNGAFSPKASISREQMAGMLFRTIKAVAPSADYNAKGAKSFGDQKSIAPWAAEGIKYLSAKGIIGGDSKGYFSPKSMVTREVAIAAILKSYNMLPKFVVPDNKIISKTQEHPSQKRLKLPESFPNEIPFTDDAVIKQITDESDAQNFPSIGLGYTSNKSLPQIKAIYKEFLKNDAEAVEQETEGIYTLVGHINNYEFTVLYLNGQITLSVTFE